MTSVRPIAELAAPATARLPVAADEGFPQAFRFTYGGSTYRVGMYVAVGESSLDVRQLDPRTAIDVTGADRTARLSGLLVADVVRERDAHETTLLHRRLLPGLSYRLAELRLDVLALAVALGNLNGAGEFGSILDIRVGAA